MAEQVEDPSEPAEIPAPRRRKRARRVVAFIALLFLAALSWAWFSRERLADDFITGQLEALGLDAHYNIESIGPRRQVLTDIVIGDPKRPDLTIERVEVAIDWMSIGIGQIKVVKPRLYGSYRGGKLSFGALDPLLFGGESKEPFRMPDLSVNLVDGRALLESDYGPVGVKAEGAGNLRSGFKGILAATAPRLALGGCDARGATLYGNVEIRNVQPGFKGPLRLPSLACANGLSLKDSGIALDLNLDRDFKGFEGEGGLKGGALAYGENKAEAFAGTGKFAWRNGGLTASYDLGLDRIATPQLALDTLGAKGSLRARQGFAALELQSDVDGEGLRPGPGLDRAMGDYAKAASGTLLGPMLAQIRTALAREGRGSSLAAELTLRNTETGLSLALPQGRIRGSSGDTLLALSSFQLSSGGGTPRFSGNFSTGGAGLPRIAGRMEQGARNDIFLRLRMAEYRAGGGSLALPELVVAQGPGGTLGFSGTARASGAIPGGDARGLVLPISGNWSSAAGLSLWRRCTTVAFDRLTLASLTLDRRSLQLCPPTGAAIVRSDGRGTRVAAGAPSLELTGRLGETPLRLKTGAVGLAWPGNLNAKDVDVALGAATAPTQFRIKEIDARIASDIGGHFSGTDVLLYSVPLDVLAAEGDWRYLNGRLELANGAFRLQDRQQPGRFEPLVARDAVLTLENNRIVANADLREPKSDRLIVKADLAHDLSNGLGHADLNIPGILFDEGLQPDTLSGLALGVIANAKGNVSGEGRIDWNTQIVTSRGSFTTSDLDFAAAFGPVEGVAGTVEFVDLLGMVTAPNQRITIESFNPGIAVDRGELRFQLNPGYEIVVLEGKWPFVGGTLELQPTSTKLTAPVARRFVLKLTGVDAAQFVERMELANLSATGTFDGQVPLVFDQDGGRIDGGILKSRPPGGNVAYVGALTYENLNPIANFAFDALKSLDYREMEIGLGGSLTGEIVTRVRFDGVKQGAGTKQNIITRRLAKLPLQFNVNIRAPFYQLIGTFKSMYDPAYVRDPKDLGLIDAQGNRLETPPVIPLPAIKPEDLPQADDSIQPRESEPVP